MRDLALEKGLPANLEAERFVLGAILTDRDALTPAIEQLQPEDFSLEKHRRIYAAIQHLHHAGEAVDRVTLANLLHDQGKLESVDGLTYLVSLDDDLPRIYDLESYIAIIRNKAVLRRVIFAGQRMINEAMHGTEAAETIIGNSAVILQALGDGIQKGQEWTRPGEVMENYPGGINAFLGGRARGGAGLRTAWPALDTMTCGMQAGELWILAGRPSMGKTAAALNIAAAVAAGGVGVAIISLEMERASLVERMVAAHGPVDLMRIRGGWLSQDERMVAMRAAGQVEGLPIWIDDSAARTTAGAQLAAVRKLRSAKPVGLVVIDHLHLMSGSGRHQEKRHEYEEITRAWKLAAKEFGCPVLLLAQLNRKSETEKRRPGLADLRESGSIEQDADVVLLVHRQEVYQPARTDLRGEADLIVAKQRSGPVGTIRLLWQREYQRFVELTWGRGETER